MKEDLLVLLKDSFYCPVLWLVLLLYSVHVT